MEYNDNQNEAAESQQNTYEMQPPAENLHRESPFADSPYVMNHQEHRGRYETPYEVPKAPKQKKSGGFWKKAVSVALTIALVAGSCAVTAAVVNQRWEERTSKMNESFTSRINELESKISTVQATATANAEAAAADGLTPGQVYARNVDAVVAIINEGTAANYFGQISSVQSSGSGFIISSDGYVISNYHVVEGAESLTVILNNGTEYPASVVGTDDANDVALLKVDAENLPFTAIGSSNQMAVGDQVVAIGNPLGQLTSTLTVGYISGKERTVSTDGTVISMMQTDAAINSGNSGGPLFNMQGEVVGITSAKYSGTTSSGASIEGIGFAIPIDDVMVLVEELKDHGYIKTAYMGVTVRDMDSQTAALAEAYGLPIGPTIETVEQGGAAAKAGIQPKDIVTALGGKQVQTVTELTRAIRNYKPGESTTITVYRSGEQLELTIAFDERPAQTPTQTQPQSGAQIPDEEQDAGGYDGIWDWIVPFFPSGK